MVDWARPRRISLVIDAIDTNAAILELARRFSGDYPEIQFLQEDARTYKPPHEYDLVHCSLSTHHFPSRDAVHLLRRSRKLSAELVLITDLRRGIFTPLGVHLANTFFQHQPMTVHDGDTSARRAFSYREFRLLAKGAGWTHFGHERFPFFRQALWLAKGDGR
jgi:hypothetical protein